MSSLPDRASNLEASSVERLWCILIECNIVAGNVDRESLLMREVLTAMIKAHEIQGCLALENSFNRVGLDHGECAI